LAKARVDQVNPEAGLIIVQDLCRAIAGGYDLRSWGKDSGTLPVASRRLMRIVPQKQDLEERVLWREVPVF